MDRSVECGAIRSRVELIVAVGAVGKRKSRSDFRGGVATGFSIAHQLAAPARLN